METRPPVCASIHPRLRSYLDEALPEAERQVVAAHLRDCPGCRAEAVAIDPSYLLVGARGGPLPASFWAPFDASLAERLRAEVRRPAAARLADRIAAALAGSRAAAADAFRPAIWLAPAAAAMVLLVSFAVLRPDPPRVAQGPRPDGIPSPYTPPRVRAEAPSGGAPAPGTSGSGAMSRPDAIPERPTLEEVASPSARVYRFDAAAPDAPPIYFVVDESIEF